MLNGKHRTTLRKWNTLLKEGIQNIVPNLKVQQFFFFAFIYKRSYKTAFPHKSKNSPFFCFVKTLHTQIKIQRHVSLTTYQPGVKPF